MYWHICKCKSKLKSYFRTFVLFLYVRYYMSGLSSPSHGVPMATIHFSTKVASFYFSGLIMTKYQKGSCILDILPSMVNKGLNNFDPRGYLWDRVNGWMALFWVACARLSDCKEVKGGSAWSRKLSHQVLRSLDVIRELKQGRFSATNVNRRWGLSFFIDATKFV